MPWKIRDLLRWSSNFPHKTIKTGGLFRRIAKTQLSWG
jgi:hypothetical protein